MLVERRLGGSYGPVLGALVRRGSGFCAERPGAEEE